jgi:hypothetical protein
MTITLLVGLILAVIYFAFRLDSLENAVVNLARFVNKPRRRDTRSPVRGAELLTRAIRAA